MVNWAARGLALLLACGALACAKQPKPAPPQPPGPPSAEVLAHASWAEFGTFQDDLGLQGLAGACLGSLGYYRRLKPETEFHFGTEVRSAAQMAASLDGLLGVLQAEKASPAEVFSHLKKSFDLLKSTGRDGVGTVLFTGYYEPWLEARRKPSAQFKYPLYAKPADLLSIDLSLFPRANSTARISGRVDGTKVVPYLTREEIVTGRALEGKGLELVWLDDSVALFFLQIQGSGRVTLEDGTTMRVQYEAGNGHPYKSLGRLMIDQGKLEKDHASMQDIQAYIKAHPDEADALLDQNPSYTFFRLETGDGPFGNIRVALTPGRSIATDATVCPRGAPCLIATDRPVFADPGKEPTWEPFARVVFNQDTGGAITGPGRVDLFFGGGPDAARAAGDMKRDGRLWFLLPKSKM
jgi:membrane-bound lytic murein transglycosylase A